MLSGQFVAWQPVLTDHQAYTLRALAQRADCDVIAYVTRLESDVRRSQGWNDVSATGVDRRLLSSSWTWLDCLRRLREHRNDVHLFCSPFEQMSLILCLLFASWMGIKVYLISEPYSPRSEGYFGDDAKLLGRVKSTLRPFIYKFYGLLLRSRLAGVFAIGRLAVDQYCKLGIPPRRIYPFGYFVPSVGAPHLTPSHQGPLRLIFVGSLIRRKGVDLLIQALEVVRSQGLNVTLDIYGPGNASTLRTLEDGIHFGGTLPFGKAQHTIAHYDALVLPSRYDGWGVVVNEALSAGIPVICSREAGASTLVERFEAGSTYAPTDIDALVQIICRMARDASAHKAMQCGALQAAHAIEPEVAADYMLEQMQCNGLKPIHAPWYVKA